MWLKRICLSFICLVLCLLIGGGLYQSISTKIDERSYPPPGKLIDVGGYRLHINCLGEGRPTVVLEAGLGSSSLEWSLVQSEIAKFAQVCSYDRAGYGWSDESPLERTSQNIVRELHELLKNASEKGPYILVGHSLGGINVRLYASTYPDEVAGVVLVDSSHEDQFEEFSTWALPKSTFESLLSSPTIASILSSVGIIRIRNHVCHSYESLNLFSPFVRQAYFATMNTTKYVHTVAQEHERVRESGRQLKNAKALLGHKPLIVITAGKSLASQGTGYPKELTDKFDDFWEKYQKDLTTKSTNSERIVAAQSGHMIMRDQPEVIVEAVRGLVYDFPGTSRYSPASIHISILDDG